MTREENLNNPGGIVQSSTVFQGEIQSSDTRFKAFVSPVMGIRALAKVILTYYNQHGLNTVQGIINRWAPPVENNTDAYVSDVANRLQVSPTEVLQVDNATILANIVKAIIHHENGEVIYIDEQIQNGVEAAL